MPNALDLTQKPVMLRPITLKDVAASAGVSTMSVSAVLNGGGRGTRQVSADARERILRSAEELGYRRNGYAAATAKGRFGSVALLTSTRLWHSYTPPALLDGINAALIERDLHLTVANLSDEVLTDETFVPKILREWMTDGLLINYIQDIPQRLVDVIERHRIPAIWMNSGRDGDCVRPNDRRAGQQATEHLLKLGHERIAFLDYSHTMDFEREHYSAGARWEGYRDAMSTAGFKPCALFCKEQSQSALDYTLSWLADTKRPTAIVTYGREVVPVLTLAMQQGLRVPEDLSCVTFSNSPLEVAFRPVTTLMTPEQAMGETAVLQLLKKIDNPMQSLPPQVMDFHFFPGATCGSPSANQK